MSTKQREIFALAQSLMRAGDMSATLRTAEDGLAEFPDDANLMCLAAKAAIVLRQFDAARSYAGQAVDKYPEFAGAHEVMGDLRLVEGDPALALESYETAARLAVASPGLPAKVRRARELLKELNSSANPAQAKGGRLNRRQMEFAEQIRVAATHERDGELDQAETIYRNILQADPDHVEASRLLAGIAVLHGRHEDAVVLLRRAVELAPDYPRALVDLANVQRHLENYEDAVRIAGKVVALGPDKAEAHMLLASVVGAAGRHDEAIGIYETVLDLDPEKAGAMCSMAHHLKTIGRQQDAIARYRECIAVRHDYAEAYWSLANLKTFVFDQPEVDAMHELVDTAELGDDSRAQIHNALGFAYEARRKFDVAFEHFEQCNLIRRRNESYDPVETEATASRVIELFTEDFFRKHGARPVEPTPIFIVGLPRSGSTLIEQILASHSKVEGTHELHDLSKCVRAVPQRSRGRPQFPDALQHLNDAGWSKIGRNYIDRTAKHRSGSPYFIDKNPNNFIFTGLIRLAMPNARIINARRHPLDSCLGTYKQLFASGQPFSYDMTELAEYYLQYQRVMDHWHSVLPGFVLDVQYEDVVHDLDGQVRRMLEHCELDFEDSCLRFFATDRAVKTASSEQVRKPIYSTSVNLWRNYESHLSTLIEILEPVLQELPASARPSN